MANLKVMSLLFVFSSDDDPLRKLARKSYKISRKIFENRPNILRIGEMEINNAIHFACNRGLKLDRDATKDAFRQAVLDVLEDMSSYCMGIAMRAFIGNDMLNMDGASSMRDQDWGTFYDIRRRNDMKSMAERLDKASEGGLSRIWTRIKEAAYSTANFRDWIKKELAQNPKQSAYDELISRMFVEPATWTDNSQTGFHLNNVNAAHRYGLDSTSRNMSKAISELFLVTEKKLGKCRVLYFSENPDKWSYMKALLPSSGMLLSRLTLDHVRPLLEDCGIQYI